MKRLFLKFKQVNQLLFTVITTMVLSGIGTVLIAQPVAAANLPTPSWWSGDCNKNNHPGAYALGASYRGVKACGGGSMTKSVNFGAGTNQLEWQCTELVKRYMYLAFGIKPYSANGDKVVANYTGTRLKKVNNDSKSLPKAGDVLSHSYVHTSIVTAVNVSGGNGTLTIMEQNGAANGSRKISVSNKKVGDSVTGWLHDATPTGNPVGSVDRLMRVAGGVRVQGWAKDKDTDNPITVHVYGGTGDATSSNPLKGGLADGYRSDVGYHVYDVTIDLAPGNHNVCVYGLNAVGTPGSNTKIGCLSTTVSGDPLGSLDSVERVPGGVRVSGWALDPDTASPITVHVYGGTGVSTSANPRKAGLADVERSDIARIYPSYGGAHGYSIVIPLNPGAQTVCAYALNAADTYGSVNPRIGCANINVSSQPYGNLDLVEPVAGGVRIAGWAIDPDVADPITVHAYGGTGASVSTNPRKASLASVSRQDVADTYPAYGATHGFDFVMNLSPGTHTVCVYALNAVDTPGSNPQIGCKTVTVQ